MNVPEAIGIYPDPLFGHMFPPNGGPTVGKRLAAEYGLVFLIWLRGISEIFDVLV